MSRPFTANERTYVPPPRPVVVVCLDGSPDKYLDAALSRDRMPRLQAMIDRGYRGQARAALPSFTNTNNVSIVTGLPPSGHGISGNFFLDPETGEEVMMNSPRYLRAETIFAVASRAGCRVATVTAKDKLREMFAAGMDGISFSAERANEAQRATHGIDDVEKLVGAPTPEVYSAEASLFVLRAGVALLERELADFVYLSTTDFIQHKHNSTDPVALEFYAAIDAELGRLFDCGAIVGVTSDHGMNAKQTSDGTPNVIYLESILAEDFGSDVRVILPITDPYVVHHGALGSFAMVYAKNLYQADEMLPHVIMLDGVTEVYGRSEAAEKLELPADRIGHLVVLAGRDCVIGRRPEDHDVTHVAAGLRSHGGREEEVVPFILSEPLNQEYAKRATGDVRNFDIFDFTVNGTAG